MSSLNHKDYEKKWYDRWVSTNSFSSNIKSKHNPYTIMMPPPNVTGSLHIGHALTFTLQDVLTRYHRMQGLDVLWQPGTDHAGIATQMVVERQLNDKGIDRRVIGREAFLEKVWEWKKLSGGQITNQLKALGASPDWDKERFTMDDGLSIAVKKVFVKLFKDGLIYKDKRLINWDTKLLTAISDLEVEQKEMESQFWYIKYPLEDNSGHVIVATTRPETMFGDVAVSVNPGDDRYFKLIGKHLILPISNRKIPIISDNYTDKEKGTGAVKITPAHDFNDFEVGKRNDLESINIFDQHGCLNQNVPQTFQGLDRFIARKKIVSLLKEINLIEKVETIINVVPHGDRSGTVIEPWLMDQWYVNAEVLAKPAINSVKSGETKFVPKNWSNTFFDWMENIQPWCISRQLWWGHRIPAWYSPDGKVFVAECLDDAKKEAFLLYGKNVDLTQDEDVLDTWFSSALWPFSTLEWPDESKLLKKYYPSNVLVTGFDIIFFWVARMMMMGIHFMDGVSPFKEVYIHALVRDEKGQKMSKSKGNVMDPLDLLEKYSADSLRFTLCAMAAQGRDIKLSEERITGYRNFSTKIINACKFLNINDCYNYTDIEVSKIKMPINLWIVHKLISTKINIDASIKNYKFNEYSDAIYKFIWRDYCDWYLEFMKPVLNSKSLEEIIEVKAISSFVMKSILKLLHPIKPFLTEELNLHFFKDRNMLITSSWPKLFKINNIDLSVEHLINIITELRAYRVKNKISFKDKISIHLKSNIISDIELIKKNENILKYIGRLDKLFYLQKENFLPEDLDFIQSETLIIGIEKKSGTLNKNQLERLLEQKNKTENELNKVNNILSNKSFLNQAPEEVVLKNEKLKKQLLIKIKEINDILLL